MRSGSRQREPFKVREFWCIYIHWFWLKGYEIGRRISNRIFPITPFYIPLSAERWGSLLNKVPQTDGGWSKYGELGKITLLWFHMHGVILIQACCIHAKENFVQFLYCSRVTLWPWGSPSSQQRIFGIHCRRYCWEKEKVWKILLWEHGAAIGYSQPSFYTFIFCFICNISICSI